MSVRMSLHFPSRKESIEEIIWSCRDHLMVDQDYVFMGHIVDMSARREENKKIPKRPSVISRELRSMELVSLKVEEVYAVSNDSLYICRASEFAKIPDSIGTSLKNRAILKYVQSIDPESWVIINVSW